MIIKGYCCPGQTGKMPKREMNWYYKAPIGKWFPVYFYSTFVDSAYIPYKTDIIPCTQLGMGILSYLKYWEYTGKRIAWH